MLHMQSGVRGSFLAAAERYASVFSRKTTRKLKRSPDGDLQRVLDIGNVLFLSASWRENFEKIRRPESYIKLVCDGIITLGP